MSTMVVDTDKFIASMAVLAHAEIFIKTAEAAQPGGLADSCPEGKAFFDTMTKLLAQREADLKARGITDEHINKIVDKLMPKMTAQAFKGYGRN